MLKGSHLTGTLGGSFQFDLKFLSMFFFLFGVGGINGIRGQNEEWIRTEVGHWEQNIPVTEAADFIV